MIKCTFENGGEAFLRHCVVDVLVIRDNQILLVKRAPDLNEGGKWALPAGFMNRDETSEECAKREVLEETGYEVEIEKFIRVNDNPNRPHEDRQNISIIYLAKPLEKVGEPDHESTEVAWFDLDQLPPKEQVAFDHYEDILSYKG